MVKEQTDPNYLTNRFTSSLSDESKRLMIAILTVDENQRLDSSQVLKHVWIRTVYDPELVIELD